MPKPKLLVFASGSKNGGGSGFKNLVLRAKQDNLNYEIVAVVSNHEFGGVRKIADELGIPFVYFPGPFTEENYQRIFRESGAEFIALSGWLKLVIGLDPRITFNIHPGPLPEFGGPGMYGHFVHEAVMKAFLEGRVTHSAVSMHFISEAKNKDDYDRGPVFFRRFVKILPDDTPETLAARVNQAEHRYQPEITELVVSGKISWDGKQDSPVILPPGYKIDWYE